MPCVSRSTSPTTSVWSCRAIYRQYSTTKLLTMERIDGPTLNTPHVAALRSNSVAQLADNIAECWFRQILDDASPRDPIRQTSCTWGRAGSDCLILDEPGLCDPTTSIRDQTLPSGHAC